VFSHKTQQIFFLQHLVIGLALDIGLHQDHQPLNFPQRAKVQPTGADDLLERQRAFLGCYYLASMYACNEFCHRPYVDASRIAAGLQKPNLLKHTPHMSEWALNLKRNQEYESDETISHLISLRQIDDQIQDTLFVGDASQMPLSDARTLMHVRLLEGQLDTWKRESQSVGSKRCELAEVLRCFLLMRV
jgi:hypothetical protein